MKPSRMQYAYSTKNFHRFQTVNADGSIKEVYVPRTDMARPVAEIAITPTITSPVEVAEKPKPARA